MKYLHALFLVALSLTIIAQDDLFISEKLEKQWETDGFDIPECVILNETDGFLYVANIAGKDLAAMDSNGFISKMKVDGSIEDLKWAEGLNGPKGMAIHQNVLYVTDIDRIVSLSLVTGQIIESIPVEGAVFLNDILYTGDGTFIISDSRASTYYILNESGIEKFMSDSTLYFPNGLCLDENHIISGVGDRIISFTVNNKKWDDIILGLGSTDGLSKIAKDTYIKSDWKGRIHIVSPNKPKELLLNTTSAEINAADFYYDKKKSLIYLPTFYGNSVVCYKLKQ